MLILHVFHKDGRADFMKRFLAIWGLALATQYAQADGGSELVELQPVASSSEVGTVNYTFDLVNTETGDAIGDTDLNISHEKKLHLLSYDPALKEFQHVHPQFDGSHWSVSMNFSVDGQYWVWVQGQLTEGESDFNAHTRLEITGGKPAWPSQAITKDARSGADGNSRVTLGNNVVKAGTMAMLNVTISREDGTTPVITPYLGAFAHAILVPNSGDDLIHVHPMAGSTPYRGMLHTTFPKAGGYRLWLQFIDGGELRTVSLAVVVK